MENPTPRPVEEWATKKNTSKWDFAITKRRERWPIGKQLTEADYDAAIARATSISVK